ncbi:hypothetical protein [Streptomyces sp. NPDC000229]|uniref:hypothetical protein n=1 Tax=Streptomyces sp. NPDC000229 TaxID=3154247 RepID=UPI003329E9A7
MSNDAPVDPAEVPVFTGNEAVLEQKVTALSGAGVKISTAAGDVHTSFGGLRAFYKAPEAEQLFATTQPVQDKALEVGSDLCVIAGALGTYADDIRPLVKRLDDLRQAAADFRDKIADDEKWREDGDLTDENLDRRNEIAEVWTQFQAAERACHDKIVALVNGTPLKVDDGSHQPGMYGYDAETLKQVESLPWGDAVAESTPGWQVWEHAGDFFEGFFVDGVWGTVTSLGTLVGVHGWDEAGQAWKGLGMVATGVAISSVPVVGGWYGSARDDQLPAWLRESRTAMKEAGKAFVAWDQWEENPARAGGTVTFNVLTTIFTGGVGGAVSGAGKAGAAAKALSFVGKAGRAFDPTTYLFKGGTASLSKIGDVMTGLRGMGHVDVNLPPGTVELPSGASLLPDGTLRLPDGAEVPPGVVEVPPGTVRLPDGTAIPPGSIDFGDGMVRLPAGTPAPPGSVPVPEGTLKVTDGTIALPEGTARLTAPNGNTVYVDPKGNLYDADGNLLQHAEMAKKENPSATPGAATSPADTSRVDTPAKQPALVGAGATASDDVLRVGDSLDTGLGDTGRLGDDLRASGPGSADRAPGGNAGVNLPTSQAANNLPDGSANAPGRDPSDSYEPTGGAAGAHGHGPEEPSASGGGEGPVGLERSGPGAGNGPGGDDPAALRGPDDHGELGNENWGTHNGEPVNYAEAPDPKAAKVYARIRESTEDVAKISENMGISPEVVTRAKENLFLQRHDVQTGPGQVQRDVYFTAYDEIADLWTRAERGTIKAGSIDEGIFRGLVIHEYVEHHLLEAGLPYRSDHPDAWSGGPSTIPRDLLGAHDIAPISFRGAPVTVDGTLKFWPAWGLEPPKVKIADDLSNLDEVVRAARRGLGL